MKEQILEFEKPLADLSLQLQTLHDHSSNQKIDCSEEIARIEAKLEETKKQIYENLTAWQRIQIARHSAVPTCSTTSSTRSTISSNSTATATVGDDHAIVAGIASLGGHRCVVIGHQKGRDTQGEHQAATSAAPTPRATARRCA